MGNNAFTRLCYICDNHDWAPRFNWLESNSNIIKLYCSNANTKYGNEYTRHSKISSVKKNLVNQSKSSSI